MRAWLERQRGLVDFTVAAMARRRGRNLGLFAAYCMVVFLLASVVLFGDALRHQAEVLLADAPEVVVQRLSAGRHDLIAGDSLAALRGVREQHGRLWGYYYDPALGANYTVMVPPAAEAPAPRHAVLGAALAAARGLEPGDVLSLRGADGRPYAFTVAGLLPEATGLVSADLMLVAEADYRAFFGIAPGLYTDLALTVANPSEVRKVAEKILDRLPGSRVVLREEMRRTYAAVFDWRQGMLLAVLGIVMVAFALLAWDKASGLSAEERREIGVLKAIGWNTADVMAMKLWEGTLLSLLAFLTGYAAAWLHVFHFGGRLFAPVLKGWSVLYPDFQLTPAVDGMQIAALAFLTVLPYVVATVVPVWRAATLDPDEVIRE